jgi:[ribosomal protein S18]-alanine N-acetyltransferase
LAPQLDVRFAVARLGSAQREPVSFSMNTWRQGSISIREARPRDLEAIGRLENESFESDRVSRRSLREFLRAPHRPVTVAIIDDELAGYVLVSLRKGGRALRIYSLAVGARFARRGVGRALLQAAEAYGRRHRREALTLEVRYDNVSAIALYESCGFRQFGEHTHYYADGATALRYEKPLLPIPHETGNNSPPERVRLLRSASRPR